MRPGEIWWADIPEAGAHPIVVLSREELKRGRKVCAAVVTSANFAARRTRPNCVVILAGEFGLERDCIIQADTFAPIPIEAIEVERGQIGKLDDERLREVVKVVGHVMDSNCEPR